MEALDLLLDAIPDERPTRVTGFLGQRYKVGDLALSALGDMVPDLPVVSDRMMQTARFRECGGCVLWDDLAHPGNRAMLQQRLKQWLAMNRERLEWKVIADYPPGGRYRLRQ
jgi:hypothetical protein